MGVSVRPAPDGERIRRTVEAMRSQGATEHDIETYLTQHEGLSPEPQMAPRDATAQTQGPVHGDLAGRVIGGVLNTATQLVTHPVQSAESMVAAPIKSFTDAVIAPSVGEARPDPRLSKGGNSAGKPLGGTYDAEHGAVTGKQRVEGAVQTLANVTAPGVARGVTAGARALGVGRGLANAAGVSAIGATTGAAYSPDDPIAGGMTGAIMAPALVGLLKVPGKLGGAVLDRTALRPATTPEVVPEATPIARNDPATAAKALKAGSDPALADPENRAVLERPGFIRLSNRAGVGGVAKTGPFIQGDQPQGMIRLPFRKARPDVYQTLDHRPPEQMELPQLRRLVAEADADGASPFDAEDVAKRATTAVNAFAKQQGIPARLTPARTLAWLRGDANEITDLAREAAGGDHQRALGIAADDHTLLSQLLGRRLDPLRRVRPAYEAGMAEQERVWDATRGRIKALLGPEPESLTHLPDPQSPEGVAYSDALGALGLYDRVKLPNRAGVVDFTNPARSGGGLQNRPGVGGVQQTGPFPGAPRAGQVGEPAPRPAGIPPEIPKAAQGAETLERLGVGRTVQPGARGMGSPGYIMTGATRLFDPLAKLAPDIQGFDTRARSAILRALEDKGMTPDDAKAALQRRIKAGEKPETIMELAGRPGARLGRTMRAASPKAGDVIDTRLEERALGAPQRTIDDALETSGLKQRSSGFQTTQQLIEQRAKDATKGYGETFQDETPINDERVTEILKTPAGRRAWKRAVTMMKNDGVKVPQGKQTTEVEIPGGKGLQSATVKVPMNVDTPTIQQLHYLKLALDDMARPGMDRGAGQGGLGFNEARSISGVKGKLLEVMDEASPAYKAAREQYAETSALKDANDLGRKLWKMHPEEAAHEYASLGSEAEKAVFRRAGMDALADRLENGPEDVAKGAKKPRDLARIRLLFPDDATFQQFKDRIAREAEMAKTYATASKGSQTADKLSDLAGMMDVPVTKLTPRRIVNAALTARGKLSSRRIAEAGAPMLTATGPELQALLDRLAQDYQTGKAGGARRTAIARAFATGVGTTTGRKP